MIIILILPTRKLKHRVKEIYPGSQSYVEGGFGFKPGLSDPRTQALRLIKYEINQSNKSFKYKQDKIGMRWNYALYQGRRDGRRHLIPYSS